MCESPVPSANASVLACCHAGCLWRWLAISCGSAEQSLPELIVVPLPAIYLLCHCRWEQALSWVMS